MNDIITTADKIFGWMDPPELEWLYEAAKRMDSIVEIGSYKGRSTYVLLSGCPGKVYVVDPFSSGGYCGDPDPTVDTAPAFRANCGHFPNLCLFRMTSKEAASSNLIPPEVDMVFIDGDHARESVLLDLQLWAPRAKKLFCGHDWRTGGNPGVEAALNEFYGMNGVAHGAGSIWYIDK